MISGFLRFSASLCFQINGRCCSLQNGSLWDRFYFWLEGAALGFSDEQLRQRKPWPLRNLR